VVRQNQTAAKFCHLYKHAQLQKIIQRHIIIIIIIIIVIIVIIIIIM